MGDDKDTKGTKGITPAEFTKRMPEGEGAGPDAPETLEPRQGHEDPDAGPGGPAMKGLGGSGPEGDETTRDGEAAPTEENRGTR